MKESAANPDELLFPFNRGNPLDPDYFDCLFAGIKEKAGLAEIRFHDLRHFFASLLIPQGFSPKYICDQLGHSSIQVTFDTYRHLFPRVREEASAKLEEAIRKGRQEAIASGMLAGEDELIEDEEPKK
jgi:integrase